MKKFIKISKKIEIDYMRILYAKTYGGSLKGLLKQLSNDIKKENELYSKLSSDEIDNLLIGKLDHLNLYSGDSVEIEYDTMFNIFQHIVIGRDKFNSDVRVICKLYEKKLNNEGMFVQQYLLDDLISCYSKECNIDDYLSVAYINTSLESDFIANNFDIHNMYLSNEFKSGFRKISDKEYERERKAFISNIIDIIEDSLMYYAYDDEFNLYKEEEYISLCAFISNLMYFANAREREEFHVFIDEEMNAPAAYSEYDEEGYSDDEEEVIESEHYLLLKQYVFSKPAEDVKKLTFGRAYNNNLYK